MIRRQAERDLLRYEEKAVLLPNVRLARAVLETSRQSDESFRCAEGREYRSLTPWIDTGK
jgi:hypothetical protein